MKGGDMCGICGVIGRAALAEGDRAAVRAMNAAMIHRGPDGAGEMDSPHAFLAMRRLAIIDLEGGWQPLYNEDRSLAVVANGEIYNDPSLRESLAAKGHTLTTRSDCEPILHLYEEYGTRFVEHLRGMFAIALWDSRRRKLVLARDRMGEKPLYLFERDGTLWFASEMKALLASGRIPFSIDPASAYDYLHYEYVPEPRTMIEGVRKLPAGCLLEIEVETGARSERRYWRMEDAPPIETDPSEAIREQLDDVSRIILRADVPVGISLSAGLDSSMLAVLAARGTGGRIHALTAGFKGGGWRDERGPARRLAEHLGLPFHGIEIEPAEMLNSFPGHCADKDDPIADIASFGYSAIASLARDNGIPVLLQGQGSDELFWGYGWLRRAMADSIRRRGIDQPVPREFRPPASLLPRNFHKTGLRDYAFLLAGHALGWAHVPPGPRERLAFYDRSKTWQMGHYAAERILSKNCLDRLRGHDPAALFTRDEPQPDLGVLLTKLACETYLLENGMAQGDRLSMRHSVELRLPLVDYRFVETVIGLRKHRPDHHLPLKARFREAIRPTLPDWVLNRPKTGFSPPTSVWMEALRGRYGASLADGILVERGLLDPGAAKRLARRRSQLTAWPTTLFKIMVLEYWARGMEDAAASAKAVGAGEEWSAT
jgi:asparagine synthase (glutamine-hydrolysing)